MQLLETVQCMQARQSSVLLINQNVETMLPNGMTVLSKEEAVYRAVKSEVPLNCGWGDMIWQNVYQ